MLGVVYVLLALAIIILLLGIANTLALAVHERRHEIGRACVAEAENSLAATAARM